jgi:hypothetical protein
LLLTANRLISFRYEAALNNLLNEPPSTPSENEQSLSASLQKIGRDGGNFLGF